MAVRPDSELHLFPSRAHLSGPHISQCIRQADGSLALLQGEQANGQSHAQKHSAKAKKR